MEASLLSGKRSVSVFYPESFESPKKEVLKGKAYHVYIQLKNYTKTQK